MRLMLAVALVAGLGAGCQPARPNQPAAAPAGTPAPKPDPATSEIVFGIVFAVAGTILAAVGVCTLVIILRYILAGKAPDARDKHPDQPTISPENVRPDTLSHLWLVFWSGVGVGGVLIGVGVFLLR
jgi:hypothetical protein